MNRDVIKAQKKLMPGIWKYSPDVKSRNSIIISVAGSGVLLSFADEYLGIGISGNALIGLIVTVITVVFLPCFLAYRAKCSTETVEAFRKGKHFVGLCSAGGLTEEEITNEDSPWIKRKDERDHICKKLSKRTFCNGLRKPAVCLTGKSGCGKSVMLEFIKNDLSDKFIAVDYTERYSEIILSYRGRTYELNEKYRSAKKEKKGLLIIFDQFERYFAFTPDEKESFRKFLGICAGFNNTAVIFAIRKDMLMDFLNEFNLSSIADNKNVCKDIRLFTDDGQRKEKRINRQFLDNKGLVICIDTVNNNGDSSVEKEIERKCDNAHLGYSKLLKNEGHEYYNEFRRLTLIEQQIALNIFENEKNDTALKELRDAGISEVMTHYYDNQLCSTGDYYNASRLMYLLSLARRSYISLIQKEVEDALCIASDEKDSLNAVIGKLRKIHLINGSYNDNDGILEVSHDYIAQSFEAYAAKEMDVNVRTAIEYYITNHCLKSRRESRHSKQKQDDNNTWRKAYEIYSKKSRKAPFASAFCFTGTALAAVWNVLVIIIRAYDAAGTANQSSVKLFNGFEPLLSVIVTFLSILSFLYIYKFYREITRFCLEKRKLLGTLYVIQGLCGAAAVVLDTFFGKWWMECLGVGTAVLGVSAIIIGYVPDMPVHGKKLYAAYGKRTTLMGTAVFAVTLCLDLFISDPPILTLSTGSSLDILLILQAVVMAVVLAYSYLSHMRKDFFYYFAAPLMELKGGH